jgi:hypothetical protein
MPQQWTCLHGSNKNIAMQYETGLKRTQKKKAAGTGGLEQFG